MRKNYLWYNLFRLGITKTGLQFFYRKIEIVNKEKIPKDKPFIILPNHQNSFMDALVVCSHMPGFIFFLTRAGAFSTKFMNWFLRSLNLLPVYRVRDGLSSVTKNNAIFDECVEYLKKGYPILIFPEANHDLRRRVRPLSKGFTRIAFDAEVKSNWEMDLQMVPVGVNYTEHRRSRNKVKVVWGDPIPMKKYQELFEQDERKAANQLKNDVASEMKKVVMHVPNLDHYPAMQVVLTELENEVDNYVNPDIVNKNVEKVAAVITEDEIEAGKQVVEISNKYDISIKTINGRKKPWALLLLLSPLYLFSWLNNIIPYLPVRKLVNTKIKDKAFDASIKFVMGLMLFPAFWAIVSLILWISGIDSGYILIYLGVSVLSSMFFKTANLFLRESLTKRRLQELKNSNPDEYQSFMDGIEKLNELRRKAL
ncbi:MAG: 1-acyl-sn-glycerol-3-phosphate acyltransferase [Balneolaceae bacterium]|nr:1-acyl-sn-glycerol-3-phosphate acyltransferase [Balneolaceae bacterium]